MNLSIITVNFNGSDRTLNLLKSLQAQTDSDFQIIVVDNASAEADFNNLKQGLSRAILIRNDQNLGFSGGNNVGIRKALENGSNWVLLLNNDTWVGNDFIALLKPILGQKTGILGLPVHEEGGGLVNKGNLAWFRPTLTHTYNQQDVGDYYVNGAAMAISREAFEVLGGLDEKYFLYFEDADYSVQAKKHGVAISFLNGPRVNHQVSSSTKKLGSPLLLRYHYRNALYFNFKNGSLYVKFVVWLWSFWIIKKQVFKIMFRYKPEESHAILNGVFDFYRHKMGQVVDF